MKFDMGAQTLSALMRDSRGSSDDLGSLIRQLVRAAEPLEGKFNGQDRRMFDQFKARADGISRELNASLSAILGGQSGMESAFSGSPAACVGVLTCPDTGNTPSPVILEVSGLKLDQAGKRRVCLQDMEADPDGGKHRGRGRPDR